jgi:hypothetical protein
MSNSLNNVTFPMTFTVPAIALGQMVNVSAVAMSLADELLVLDGNMLFFIGVPASISDVCDVSTIPQAAIANDPFSVSFTNFTGLSCILLDSDTTMQMNVC